MATGSYPGPGRTRRSTGQATKEDRRRIKELERELRRKDKALAETAALLVLSKKSRGDLPQERGRMIVLEDRQRLAQDIEIAKKAGARLSLACQTAGITVRTLQRWQASDGDGLLAGDGRPQAARPVPAHALSPAEQAQMLQVANEPRFADVPPARIVPILADEGCYIASPARFAPQWWLPCRPVPDRYSLQAVMV